MPPKRAKQQKKAKKQNPGSKVPPTPVSASDEHDKSTDKNSGRPDTKSAPGSPYLTPPTSPSSPTIQPFSMDVLAHELQKLDLDSGADDAATSTQEHDHAATEANGSQEEQVDSDQQTQDDIHTVEHSAELEQETQTEQQQLNSELQALFTSENAETFESDERQTGEEENVLTGEHSNEDSHQDEDQVQIEPNQQPHDEFEQQASVETPKEDGQTQTQGEDLLGKQVPDTQDDHHEDDAGQGELNDTNAESQESQGSDTQNEVLSEGQQEVDSAPQSQELEPQQLIDFSEQQEGDDTQQTSELDDQPQDEQNGDSRPATEDISVNQENTGDLIGLDFENNDQQLEDGQNHFTEKHAIDVTELHDDEKDLIATEDQVLDQEQELGEGDQQLAEDHDQALADGQQFATEPEQVAKQGQQLEEQGPIEANQQAADEQEQAYEAEEQVEAEPGHVAETEDDQQHENQPEPVENDYHLDGEAEHTPEAYQMQEQEPQTIVNNSEQQHQDELEVIKPDEQAEAELANAAEGDQLTGQQQQQAIENDQLDEGQTIESGEHVEKDQGPVDSQQRVDHEDSSEGNSQFEEEQDVSDNDEALRTELMASQQPNDSQEEADVADHELEFDSLEILVEPPEDGLGIQSDQEYVDDQQIETEQEHTEGEDDTLGDDQEDNELAQQETDTSDHFEVQLQNKDDPFLDEEQDTAYEPELEDIQEMTEDEMEDPRAGAVLDISAKDVASRDLLAIADLFANMKSTLASMSSAFDRLGSQTEKMASLGLDAKAAEQLKRIKSTLEAQIARHKAEVETVKNTLHAKVKEALEARIRNHLHDVIKGSVQNIIEEKVRQELSAQIPEDLRQQVISHKRQILEVKASLHNSEARRYNALQTIPTLNARLRPLLRPLPTPEQSPIPISISRSSSMGHSTLATPTTAFPQVPAPTPIRRTGSNSFRPIVPDAVPPSPSPFFPRDMSTLFALNPEETKRLLREYGLSSTVTSPAVEHPMRPRGLSIVNEDAAEEEDPDIHARDLNTFMAHIGVPFLMIPAPKEKHNQSAPLSSRSRRKLLTPLIIK